MTDENKKDEPAAGANGAPPSSAPPAKELKAKPVEKAPAPPTFRDADYTGPLTGDQAAWRNANIKPASAKTK